MGQTGSRGSGGWEVMVQIRKGVRTRRVQKAALRVARARRWVVLTWTPPPRSGRG